MKIRIFTSLDKEFLKAWRTLWESSHYANYINGPQWFLSVIKTFGHKDYRIIAIYRKGSLVAVAALTKEKKYWISFYTLSPGDYICGIPFLVNTQDREIVKALLDSLLKLNICIANVPSEFVSLLQRNISKPYLESIPGSLNYYLAIEKNNKGIVSVKNRKKLMYEARKVEDKFNLKSFRENLSVLELVLAIDGESRKQRRGYNAFSSENIRIFYSNLIANFEKNMIINIMYFHKKPIAYEIGFISKGIYSSSQIAFDEYYRRFSPGKVLYVKLACELAVKEGISILDFGSGESLFKHMFTKEYRHLSKIIISKNPLIRFYIRVIFQYRKKIFDWLQQKKGLYSKYRYFKNMINI